MASPQKENGYTPIANEILEAIVCSGLNGAELAVLLYVVRKTYGFQKKEDEISLTQFEGALPYTRPTICKALKVLQLVNIVKLVKVGKSRKAANRYAFNKNYESWKLVKRSKLVKDRKSTSKGLEMELVKKPLHTKETITKEIYTKEKEKTNYGELCNVRLSGEEHKKLTGLLGKDLEGYINRLDLYIGSTGKKYKSHYATILNWWRKDTGYTMDEFYQGQMKRLGDMDFCLKYGEKLTKKYLKYAQ